MVTKNPKRITAAKIYESGLLSTFRAPVTISRSQDDMLAM